MTWNPAQYNLFEKERSKPFFDLLSLVQPQPTMQVIDLGCGTGQLTRALHETLKAKQTLGIDSSESMLRESKKFPSPDLSFQNKNIIDLDPNNSYDLIFSNAALQWLPNHQELIPNLISLLTPKGQIAVQVPANFDFPTHTIAKRLSQKYMNYLQNAHLPGVLTLEEYSDLFFKNGIKDQIVRAQIYPLDLNSSKDLIEWVKGSLLTFFEKNLPKETFQEFMQEYTHEIEKFFGVDKPVFVPFKRFLMWGHLQT